MPPSPTHGAASCCVIFNSKGHWRYDCKQMTPSVSQLHPDLQRLREQTRHRLYLHLHPALCRHISAFLLVFSFCLCLTERRKRNTKNESALCCIIMKSEPAGRRGAVFPPEIIKIRISHNLHSHLDFGLGYSNWTDGLLHDKWSWCLMNTKCQYRNTKTPRSETCFSLFLWSSGGRCSQSNLELWMCSRPELWPQLSGRSTSCHQILLRETFSRKMTQNGCLTWSCSVSPYSSSMGGVGGLHLCPGVCFLEMFLWQQVFV